MSARALTLRHMAKAVQQSREGEATDPEALGPDEMKLYSFYKPSLLANNYIIEAKQTVTANTPTGTQSLEFLNTRVTDNSGTLDPQEFEVVVPRFSLDQGLVNSYYPPDGHQDEGRVLPHIVFNDPHFPWEIPAGVTTNMDGIIYSEAEIDGKATKGVARSMVPWVALLVFDPEELNLPSLQDITSLNIPGYTEDTDVAKQNTDGTFSMKVSDYFAQIPQSSRINYQAGYSNDDAGKQDYAEITSMTSSVNVIFPTKPLFNQLFVGTKDTDDHKHRVESHKYLAHVRHINTVGFPDAGVVEEGLFSILLSSRTGAFDITQPRTQICHLVSIEHVDSTLGSWIQAASPSNRIGMVSLFSWVYTALPPDPVNFIETMTNLTTSQQMLRTDNNLLAGIAPTKPDDRSTKSQAAKVVADRLKLGYTIARWRSQSGEESAAFNRGPLVPQPVTWPPAADLPDCSNTSQDYQILDSLTGLMDLSYSSAWQAGKLLAISDSVFSSALMRFRSRVRNSSADQTRRMLNKMSTKSALISSIKESVASVQAKSVGDTGDPHRFIPRSNRSLAPDLLHPETKPTFFANIKDAVNTNTNAGQEIYNEFNLNGPNNSDWVIIHDWLCEKLSLGGIPPQYLIPEPSYLKPESLRFFHIDDFWLDCLLDGALSVANHLDSDDDVIRREIKETFNVYLRTVVTEAGYKPQIPTYGFIIRSKLIKAMPDLRITVAWINPDNRAPVCRWTKWDNETLMCLLDRQPEELASITLAQPAHQQRFCLGSHLSMDGLTFKLRTLYTKGAPDGSWQEKNFPGTDLLNKWFDTQTRCIKLHQMTADINKALQFGTAIDVQNYIDPTPNSCEFGLEMNDPSYFFAIVPPSNASVAPRDRQLFVRQIQPPITTSATMKIATKLLVAKPDVSIPKVKAIPVQIPGVTLPQVPLPAQPPHQQLRIEAKSSPAIVQPIFRAIGGSTVTSKFKLALYPDFKGTPTRYDQNKYDPQDYIPTNNLYFFDLIFSIRKTVASSASQYKLLRIDIDIPVATTPPAKTEVLLTANYDGPGLRMLSNQRFIPFLFNNDDGKLHIELVPRSANDSYALTINDRKSAELGFRLAEANISPVVISTPVDIVGERMKQMRGLVVMTMTEWYSTPANPTGEPVSTPYNLIKWQKQDDSL